MAHPFHTVDVFAERRYAGNQLAVIEDAADLDDETMQAIARETDYSETTFVEGQNDDGSYRVRIFTPEEEIPFAGHPTLGTAAVIRAEADDASDRVFLDLDVGGIPVRVETVDGDAGDATEMDESEENDAPGELFWMTQRPPTFEREFTHEEAAAALSLAPEELDDDYPVQAVSTGLPTVIVPLDERAALERIDVDREAYDALTAGHDAKNVLAFCPDPRDDDNDFAARVFAPYYDVPEDPATGSSNGCLAGYLIEHGYADGDVDARVEQGYEMGRPSLLHLQAWTSDEGIVVEVGGRVVPVVDGTIR